MNRRLLAGLVLGLATMVSLQASAAPTLDFNMDALHPATAQVSFAGNANPLVGVDISVDNVVGLGTPLNNNIITTLTGALLNFTTGNLVSSTANTWNFGAGGANSITIFGDDGIGPAGATTLLAGQITEASVFASTNSFRVAIAAFFNVIDVDLAANYGLPSSPFEGNFNLSFEAAGSPPGAFTSSEVLSGDVVTSLVPEPNTLVLAGMAIIAGICSTRWQTRRAKEAVA